MQVSAIPSLTCGNKEGRFQRPGEALPLSLAHSATLVTLASYLKHTGDSLAQGFPLDGTTQGACLGGLMIALRRCHGCLLSEHSKSQWLLL